MDKRILIVCVGNICRSPMGEALWNHRRMEFEVSTSAVSAGLAATADRSIHPITRHLLLEKGIDVPEQRSRPLELAMLREADLVLVMETWHKAKVQRLAPFLRGRVYTLGHWQGYEIPDPYNASEAMFRSVFQLIDRGVCEWLRKLNGIGSF
ncbi:low molecular weight protein-tyrosine-phosphatase [Methylocaldum sp. RMAD-M]|jgi:protein-tyrosine phosphatase|uniref:low molecular weight protein-tyrosine-phosphatase n=1 Tax=Methylocaldum sp. RMAD-M TaxID=2806557 RepID=UPI000A31F195|nr:low molecular weight protein-tyrosine-phosphatase [Methylocaldum sp. RMAD-M]MBP1152830.1 protein-tyrosine phosphatase [Methylocaldum sp. RMAD-M]